MLFIFSLLSLLTVKAQFVLHLNGYEDEPINPPKFDYFQGGRDWPGLCAYGHYQSPIDITPHTPTPEQFQVVSPANSTFRPLALDVYSVPRSEFYIADTGAFVAYMFFETSLTETSPKYDDVRLNLADFHLKTPAEHTINGMRYPMSMQVVWVYRQPDRNKYISTYMHLMFQEGRENPLLTQLIQNDTTIDVTSLFPASGVIDDYFYYIGSMSFPWPECLEPEAVVIPNYVLDAAPWQIDYWRDMYINNLTFSGGRGNARDVQPLYDRVIYHVVPE